MWTLPAPDVSAVAFQLERALLLRSATPVYAMSALELTELWALYAFYDAQGGQPNANLNPGALTHARQSIHDAYDQIQARGRLRTLRASLLVGQPECPLCGFGEPRTLDHYLPKVDYKCLAIYPKNLVPACQACNRFKGTGVPGDTAGYIHPYFETLPPQRFLVATAAYDAPALQVTFAIDGTYLDGEVTNRLSHQLTALRLEERYIVRINTMLSDLKPALDDLLAAPNSPHQIQQFFQRCASSYGGRFGLNHWKTALMEGLAGCASFCANPLPYFGINAA